MAELNRERVEDLTTRIMRVIVDSYGERPRSRDRVYEVLNALGFAVSVVMVGTGSPDGLTDSRKFFDQALEMSLTQNLDFTRSHRIFS
jgi:hypothetical protein